MNEDQTELFIALVAAVGTDVGLVGDQVATQLDDYGYTSHLLRLSNYLAEQVGEDFQSKPFDEALWDAMTAGDRLRQAWDRNDALALHAVSDIVATREELDETGGEKGTEDRLPQNLDRHAFILRSLKTPDELETLRAIYGPRLVVIAAYSPETMRLKHLAEQIEDSRKTSDRDTWEHQPEDLVERDEKEEEARGQDVSGTFHRADFFIRGWNRDVAREDIARAFEILFGSPFRTPTRDEHGQFLAAGAALRSAEFGRQVGAAISTPDGSIIAVGTNEVPKPGGGSHWEEDDVGNRDFEIGEIDTNRRHFDDLARDLSDRIAERLEKLVEEFDGRAQAIRVALSELQERLLAELPGELRAGGLADLTEFGRAVHAEMNALIDAARRGISVADTTLHTTTFPCHNCARHIIGAGITRVVFIEPYEKSRTEDLHGESLKVDQPESDRESDLRIAVEHFVGVAPRRYMEMFDAASRERLGHLGRKDTSGRKREFVKKSASPVFADAGLAQFRPELKEYRAKELLALDYFRHYSSQQQ